MKEYLLVYFLVLAISMLLSIFNRRIKGIDNIFYFLIICTFLSLFFLRDLSIGKDTYNYLQIFNDLSYISGINNIFFYSLNYSIEIGFCLLVYFLGFFVNPIWIFNVIAAVIYVNFCLVVKRFNINSFIYFCSIFSYLGFYSLSFNVIRQILAISIIMVAINYLLNGNKSKFLFLVFLAASFHYSALICLFFYLIYLNSTIFLKYRFLVIAFIVFISKFLIYLTGIYYPRYLKYINSEDDKAIGFILFFYFFIFLFLCFFERMINLCRREYTFLLNIFSIYIALVFSFLLNGIFNDGTNRLVLYFLWPLPILLGIFFKNLKEDNVKYIFYLLFLIFSTAFFYLSLSKSGADFVPFMYRV